MSYNPASWFHRTWSFPTHFPIQLLTLSDSHKWYPWKIRSSVLMLMELVKTRPTPIQTDPKSQDKQCVGEGEEKVMRVFGRAHRKEVARRLAFFCLGSERLPCQPGVPASPGRFQPPTRDTYNQLALVMASLPGTPGGLCQDAPMVLLRT